METSLCARRGLPLALLTVLLLSGCGGVQDRAAAASADRFHAAVDAGDGRTACALLAPRTRDALERAQSHAAPGTAVERALAAALDDRYPRTDPGEDFSVWNTSYADAMGRVYAAHPDDLDVATLYADALMNLTPWQLWDITTGEPAEGARTVEDGQAAERLDALHE